MRLFVFLLFITANLVICTGRSPWDEVRFPLSILQPDVDAIANYFERFSHIEEDEAFIYWPNSITFLVTKEIVGSEEFAKVLGDFKTKGKMSITTNYGCLYYKEGQFYVPSKTAEKMKPIPESSVVYYEEREVTGHNTGSRLSIQYRSIDEIRAQIQPFYAQHKHYLDEYSWSKPSTYLVSDPYKPTEHFLEYTTWSDGYSTAPAEGGLHVLIGKIQSKKVRVDSSGNFERLVFRQHAGSLSIPVNSNTVQLPFVDDVFGVRMQSIGFLAEMKGDVTRMLSSDDLSYGADRPPREHTVQVGTFMEKVAKTEPRADVNRLVPTSVRVKGTRFQVHGHLLVKKMNIPRGYVDFDEECPFIIEYQHDGIDFKLGTTEASQLCTDDDSLWPLGGDASSYDPYETITLSYPAY